MQVAVMNIRGPQQEDELWGHCITQNVNVAVTRHLWLADAQNVVVTRHLWLAHAQNVAVTRHLWLAHAQNVAVTRDVLLVDSLTTRALALA